MDKNNPNKKTFLNGLCSLLNPFSKFMKHVMYKRRDVQKVIFDTDMIIRQFRFTFTLSILNI